MAWITLSLRKQELKTESSELEMVIISKSREVRNIQRNLAYQKAIVDADESAQLHDVKKEYNAVKDKRPMQFSNGEGDETVIHYFRTKQDYENWKEKGGSVESAAGYIGSKGIGEEDNNASKTYSELYSEWKEKSYEAAKERYQEQSTYIKDMADDEKEMLEDESTEKQSVIDEEKTILETNLQDINQEMQSLDQQIGTDIQSEAAKFGS